MPRELLGRLPAQGSVWPCCVVSVAPITEDPARLEERGKVMLVEAFVAKPAVEAFDERILHRFPRRNMMQPNAPFRRPS